MKQAHNRSSFCALLTDLALFIAFIFQSWVSLSNLHSVLPFNEHSLFPFQETVYLCTLAMSSALHLN